MLTRASSKKRKAAAAASAKSTEQRHVEMVRPSRKKPARRQTLRTDPIVLPRENSSPTYAVRHHENLPVQPEGASSSSDMITGSLTVPQSRSLLPLNQALSADGVSLSDLQQRYQQLEEYKQALIGAESALKHARDYQMRTEQELTIYDTSSPPPVTFVRQAGRLVREFLTRTAIIAPEVQDTSPTFLALSRKAAEAVRMLNEQKQTVRKMNQNIMSGMMNYHRAHANFNYNGRWLLAHRQWMRYVQNLLIAHHSGGYLVPPRNAKVRLANLPLQIDAVLTTKSGMSNTVVTFGKCTALPSQLKDLLLEDVHAFDLISCKTSWMRTEDNSLDVEREIIYNVFNLLQQRWHCPHVVCSLADIACPSGQWEFTTSELQDEFNTAVHKAQVKPNVESHAIVMDRCIPLMALFVDASKGTSILLEKDFYAILWQVYYTLSCFERMGIRHNDLHLNNLLYRELSAPEDIYYHIPNPNSLSHEPLTVHIRTRYLIKFYDMDRGSMYHPFVERNVLLDNWGCRRYGECAGGGNSYDVGAFTLGVLQQLHVHLREKSSWFDFVCTVLFSKSAWDQYQEMMYPQAFVFEAKQQWMKRHKEPFTLSRIGVLGSGIECLHALLGRTGISVVAAMDSQYALPLPFSLPKQVIIELREPKLSKLGRDILLGKETLDVTPITEAPAFDVDQELSQLYGNILQKNKQWAHKLNEWRDEISQDGPKVQTWQWLESARDLYFAYVTTHGHAWKTIRTTHLALLCASMILTCPMFYGLPRSKRDSFRQIFVPAFNSKGKRGEKGKRGDIDLIRTAEVMIRTAEVMIWNTFGETLPVRIPDLYDIYGV